MPQIIFLPLSLIPGKFILMLNVTTQNSNSLLDHPNTVAINLTKPCPVTHPKDLKKIML